MLTKDQVAIVKGLLARGDKQQDIAAFFGENGGRIAEIHTGKKHADVQAAHRKDLPTISALASGFPVHMARQTLVRAKAGIEAAMAYLDDFEANREGYAQAAMVRAAEAKAAKARPSRRRTSSPNNGQSAP